MDDTWAITGFVLYGLFFGQRLLPSTPAPRATHLDCPIEGEAVRLLMQTLQAARAEILSRLFDISGGNVQATLWQHLSVQLQQGIFGHINIAMHFPGFLFTWH
jgi:hypothetical protein